MIAISIGMFCAVFAVFSYLAPRTKRRVVGYGLAVDIAVWVLFLAIFGGTGMERMAAVFAAMGVTAFIHTYRFAFGYERIVGRRWVFYPGKFRKVIS